MKKTLGLLLSAALTAASTPAHAELSDTFRRFNPDISEKQYQFVHEYMEKAEPMRKKFREGELMVTLPAAPPEYFWRIQKGDYTVYEGEGDVTITHSFDLSSETNFYFMILRKPGRIMDKMAYQWDPETKRMKSKSYETLLDELNREMEKVLGENSPALPTVPDTLPEDVPFPDLPFVDIADHWARDAILRAAHNGYVNGYGDRTFKPDNNITRAEFIAMLAKALPLETTGKPASVFTDDAGWAEGAIQAAIEQGIIDPADYPDRKFEPDKNITRQELAVFTVRAAGMEGRAKNTFISDSGGGFFTDMTWIPEQWRGYVKVASDSGIVGGYEDGSFKPDNPATRAEAVAMVGRMLDKLER